MNGSCRAQNAGLVLRATDLLRPLRDGDRAVRTALLCRIAGLLAAQRMVERALLGSDALAEAGIVAGEQCREADWLLLSSRQALADARRHCAPFLEAWETWHGPGQRFPGIVNPRTQTIYTLERDLEGYVRALEVLLPWS